MYGDKGPPKGYSVPRHDSAVKAQCQHCSAQGHWSYECPANKKASESGKQLPPKEAPRTAKLSRTQMLKYGVKRKRAEFVPEATEREAYDQEMKSLETILAAEVRQSVRAERVTQPQSTGADPTEARSEPALPPARKERAEAERPASEPAIKREQSPSDSDD